MERNITAAELQTRESCFNLYHTALETARSKFEDKIFPLLTETKPETLLKFWLYFSKEGVGMTEPVEGWIRRAGDRCVALGYEDLGQNLRKHAIHEANHHLMMIEDTEKLVAFWNQHYSPKIALESFFAKTSPFASVNDYVELHEHYIQSTEPYCQIAIEYEIESLSATFGMEVLKHSFSVLGEDLKPCLSFLFDHAKIDVAHTQFNRKTMSQFLAAHPDTTDHLIEAGIKALRSYGNFVSDCWDHARQ